MSSVLKKRIRAGDSRIVNSLVSLHPGVAPAQLLTEYHTGKIRMLLIILGVGSLLAFCTGLAKDASGVKVEEGIIQRGEETQTIMLEAKVKENGAVIREKIPLQVEERALPQQEAEELCKVFIQHLNDLIPGENESLQEVRQNLYLPDEVDGYPFVINWISGNASLVGNDGKVLIEELEEVAEVVLRAEIIYGEWEWQYSWQIILSPPIRTDKEQLVYELKKYSDETERAHLYDERFALPDKVEGREIRWSMKEEDLGMIVLGLTLAAAVAVYRLKDRDLQSELLKRREEIQQAYPELVSKYALFLGAGMTVRGAFQKICNDYYVRVEEEKRRTPKPIRIHPLYEEMLYACNELRAGVSESKVYENFGLRTGVPEYTRLATLLNQNLKKGNSALVQRLRAECEEALQAGNQLKKRKGEEAGTQLLLPMIMMLLMVLLMIMLPAFSGLGV